MRRLFLCKNIGKIGCGTMTVKKIKEENLSCIKTKHRKKLSMK